MVEDRGFPAYRGDLSPRSVTIAEALRGSGYRTAMVGKWHVTPLNGSKHNWPTRRGFEGYYGTIHGAGNFYDPVSLVRDETPIEPDRPDFYYTDALSEEAARAIGDLGRGQAPFFLYAAFTAPHWPMHAPAADVARNAGRYDGGWDALRAERHARMIGLGIVDRRWPLTPRDAEARAWADVRHRDWQARRMEVYAAMIERLDQAVGRIVAALRDAGRLDNTLILLLADNGGCAEELGPKATGAHVPKQTHDGRPVRIGNDPAVMPGPEDTYQSYGLAWANASNTPFRRFKHWVHEGGIATPLIAHWPAVVTQGGTLTRQPGHLIDVMATCLDVAGAAYPRERDGQPVTPLEGKSLRPVLEGRTRQGQEALFWEHEGNRAVRKGQWKLVSRHPGRWELYDLEADRTELNDLAAREPGRVSELSSLYERWAGRVGVRPWDEVMPPKDAAKKAR
jgi:arylsulfatase